MVMVFDLVRSIVFDIVWSLDMIGKCNVFSLLAILILGNTRVYISISYSSKVTLYIEISIDQGLGRSTTLGIPYIDSDYSYIRFQ